LITVLAIVNISYRRYEFWTKIEKIKIEKGLTQQQLTKKLGYVTNSYISHVESGHFIPSREKLKKIARALEVSFKEIKDMLLETRLEALGMRA
jgi:transcriptional regulator with XRE-family HTH domain